jgi:hypothetical protein
MPISEHASIMLLRNISKLHKIKRCHIQEDGSVQTVLKCVVVFFYIGRRINVKYKIISSKIIQNYLHLSVKLPQAWPV